MPTSCRVIEVVKKAQAKDLRSVGHNGGGHQNFPGRKTATFVTNIIIA